MSKYLAMAVIFLCLATHAQAQQINNNVVIVFDDSGSMNETFSADRSITKLEAAKSALKTVVTSMPDNTRVGILLLNGRGAERWIWKLDDVSDKNALVAKIETIGINGGTPLYRSVKNGMDALLEHRGKTFYGSYRLLVVTDGEETENRNLLQKYLPDMLTRGIDIEVIGVDMGRHTLKDVAETTSILTYRSADDPASLTKQIESIVSETEQGTDSSAEDFAIVAGLPDGFAIPALQALHDSGNHPIGEIKQVVFEDGKVVFDENGNPVTQEVAEEDIPFWVILLLAPIVTIVLIFIAARSRR